MSLTKFTLCRILIAVSLFFAIFLPLSCLGAPQKNYFPLFPAIADNVKFWEKVYSTYSVNTAVVHDKSDLSKIYETIPLLDKKLPGASRVNRSYINRVKKNYTDILKNLSLGKIPTTPAEKRVSNMFSPPGILKQFKIAAENIRVQTGLKERFSHGVVKSGAYIKKIKKILRSYNLPEDLAYLPHVESSFNIKAYSKSGAAGIWQFTRSTGRDFMTIDYIVDERLDPMIATHAAAKYLKQNFKTLGSWPLAITAYNYGHSGMQRAVLEQGTYENIFTNYKKGYFKFASRNFYSEFLAARNIAKQMEKSKNLQQERPKKYYSLKLQGYAHVNDISNHFNLNPTSIKKLNPSLRTPIWKGEKYIPQDFLLQLPHSQKTVRLARTFPRSLLHKNQKRSQFYHVRKGDTAGKIARIHGVTLRSLSNANNLNKDSIVYIGQRLRIPSSPVRNPSPAKSYRTLKDFNGSKKTFVTLSETKKNSPSLIPTEKEKIADPEKISVISSTVKNGVIHGEIIVQPEESFGIYAEWLKISKQNLLSFSNIAENESIHPGQKIILPFINTTQKIFEVLRQEFHQETEEDFFSSYKITGFRQYRVAQGDTLWDICQNKFDLPLWLLRKYNSNLNYNRLISRQHLKIPIIESI